MPSDTAIVRLLYAILSQKCLKDINWEKVAQDPVLAQEINNGHAALMRYARFKKQMEKEAASASSASSSSSSLAVNNRKARKARISRSKQRKNSPHRVKQEALEDDVAAALSFDSKTSGNSAREIQTPEPDMGGALGMGMRSDIGAAGPSDFHDHLQSYVPNTPNTTLSTPTHSRAQYYLPNGAESPSPSASFNHAAPVQDCDLPHHSFNSDASHMVMNPCAEPLLSSAGLFGEFGYDASHHDLDAPQYGEWIHSQNIHQDYVPDDQFPMPEEYEDSEVNVKTEIRWAQGS